MPQAKVGEVELCYESIGEGKPLLMIMGIGCQLVFWPDELCQGLVERGFRVIRFDNRDVGQSSRLDHLGVPDVRRELVRWGLGLPVRAPTTRRACSTRWGSIACTWWVRRWAG